MSNKVCPECGKYMIKEGDGRMLMTNPPQYPWHWWCKCGNTEDGGCEVQKSHKQIRLEAWEHENEQEKA